MSISAVVGCGLSTQGGKAIVCLDREIMEKENLPAGAIVKIQSRRGKYLLAKVAAAPDEKRGSRVIHLDHYLRRALKVMPKEEVTIEMVEPRPVKRAFFMPVGDNNLPLDTLKEDLKKTIAVDSIPIALGSIVFVSLPYASVGSILKVTQIEPGPGIVTVETEVEVVSPTAEDDPHDGHDHGHAPLSDISYEDVGGLGKEIRMLRELLEVPLRFPQVYNHLGIHLPRGIIFHGPVGVGKTHLALALANELDAQLFYINGPEIISTEFGETERSLRRIFREAGEHKPAIILIDELDAIAPKRSETGSVTTTRTVSTLLSLLDGLKKAEGIIVIGTTNSIDAIDTAARRPGRFDREFLIRPPDSAARLEILGIHSRALPIDETTVAYLPEMAERTIGFVGADLMELCREAGLNAFRRRFGSAGDYSHRLLASLETLTVTKADFDHALSAIRPSAMREITVTATDIGWGDIGGLQEVKKLLRELVQFPLLHPETFASLKIRPPAGVLIYGPPGTGKTMLAKALAKECQANFIDLKGSDIFSKWVGESEAAIRSIFQLAYRVTPAIIFFDNLDAMAPCRGREAGVQAAERVVSQLLSEMDSIPAGSRVVVVAATNRIDLIDPALLQANRFGLQIFTPLPDEEERKAILHIFLKDVPLDTHTTLEEVVETVAAASDDFSAAELASLCNRVKMTALRNGQFENKTPIELRLFQETMEQVKASRFKG